VPRRSRSSGALARSVRSARKPKPAPRTDLGPDRNAVQDTPEPFRTSEVAQLLGVSRRQLQYWAKTDLVRPSHRTRGGHHRYAFRDLVALKAAKRLIDAGVSVQRIRTSIGALRRILPSVSQPLAELVLVATGDVVLVLRDGSAFEAVSGQEWVFEVARFQREVSAFRRAEQDRARRTAERETRTEQR
jgi:DNA-binding transcriptional MerR regulator